MVITLTGTNSFLLGRELKRLTNEFVAEQGDFALEQLDGAEVEIDRLQEALTSLPFLASKKMVILRSPSTNKQFAERAEQLFANLPETTDVILVEPKLDKRLAYYKFLKKQTDFREYSELDPNGLAQWLLTTAKERGGTLSSNDARYLIERVGGGQQLLSNELEKLLLHASHITRQTIDLMTEATPQSKIFDLLDAAFAGNHKRALQLYAEQRVQKVEPQIIISMLTWQLYQVVLIKTAGDRRLDDIARDSKASPYTLGKSAAIARRLTLADLKKLLADLLKLDTRSKRQSIDLDEALQHYLLTLV